MNLLFPGPLRGSARRQQRPAPLKLLLDAVALLGVGSVREPPVQDCLGHGCSSLVDWPASSAPAWPTAGGPPEGGFGCQPTPATWAATCKEHGLR